MFIPLDFIIDKITNSIEEVASGKSLPTEVVKIDWIEISKIHKKDGWRFNWKEEYKKAGHQIFKLIITKESETQGLISINIQHDQRFIDLALIEVAPHNFGSNKKFEGVAGNLIAFICKLSYIIGFEGVVAFTAKTNLIEHYKKTLGAEIIFTGGRMSIFSEAAKKLITLYYKDFFHDL